MAVRVGLEPTHRRINNPLPYQFSYRTIVTPQLGHRSSIAACLGRFCQAPMRRSVQQVQRLAVQESDQAAAELAAVLAHPAPRSLCNPGINTAAHGRVAARRRKRVSIFVAVQSAAPRQRGMVVACNLIPSRHAHSFACGLTDRSRRQPLSRLRLSFGVMRVPHATSEHSPGCGCAPGHLSAAVPI